MKLVYIICILFTVTISSIASDNAGTTQPINQQTERITNSTASLGKISSSAIAVDAFVAKTNNTVSNNKANITDTIGSTTIDTNVETTIDNTKSTIPTTVDVNTKPINTNSTTVTMQLPTDKTNTTDKSTETTASTVTRPTVPTTVTTTNKPDNTTTSITTPNTTTTSTTITQSTSTTNSASSSSASETTTIPMSTKVVPPSMERHFDGLSFAGGIILATCLIAIGVLFRKFAKTSLSLNYGKL